MKPVSYQSTPSPANGGHQNLDLDPVLSSKVMYCEKCGYPSTDAAMLEKHMSEHTGTPFYCFYCNNVSFSKAELNAHLKLHTSKYRFTCPHCGQGYVRRQCFVKHIERVHNKSTSQGPAKPDMKIISPVPVSGALSSVATADPSPLRPAVRVTVPVPSAPAVRLKRDEQRGKILDTNVSIAANANTERVSPLNGLIQNRALTVSLPEEVTIPAGCMVELVEVKTVNGTKELKLRLVSQQENESVIKDTRTSVSQSAALGKPLSSTLNHQTSSVKSVSTGMCNINRKPCETKTVNVECPAVAPVGISKNLLSQEKSVFKRPSQEIIKVVHNAVVPHKIQKTILSAGREGNSGMQVTRGEPVHLNGAPSTVISGRRLTSTLHPDQMGKSVSQRAVEEKKNSIPDHSKSVPPQKTSDTISIPRDVSASVKWVEKTHPRNNTVSKKFKDTLGWNQQRLNSAPLSSSAPLAAAIQVRPPAVLACTDNDVVSQSFPTHRILNKPPPVKKPVLANHLNSKVSACKQEVRSSERAGDGDVREPESFPIISSVFSLSQQPQETQGTIQPLVMALRGIVMDETCDSRPHEHIKMEKTTENVNKMPKTEFGAKVDKKDVSVNCDRSLTEQPVDSVKVEMHDKGVQQCPALMDHHVQVKVEKNVSMQADNNDTKCTLTPVEKSSTEQGSGSKSTTQVDVSLATDALQQIEKSKHDVSSRFLTVSLKRVQVGVWKKSSKGLKLRISKYKAHLPAGGVADCAVIYPMPLKEDQLVKRPGPNQPVVVLNHPKPRAPVQGTRADTAADTGASAVVPKCQILKMRLSKVMGQKYEVMGCTVRVFP